MPDSLIGLIEADKAVTLFLNGSDCPVLDNIVYLLTSAFWMFIPLAITLLYVIWKNNNLTGFIIMMLGIGMTILICDQFSAHICKPLFHRLRPTHDPAIQDLVDTLYGIKGGMYGFISSHAANAFGVATFLMLVFKNRRFTISAYIFAFIFAYTRIYMGVHFVGDILCGAICGILFGWLIYFIYSKIHLKDANHNGTYNEKDLLLFRRVLYGTYLFAIFFSIIHQCFLLYWN